MLTTLNTLPNSSYPFIWSDYAELQALSNETKSLSEAAFTEMLLGRQQCNCASHAYTPQDAKALWTQLIEHCENRTTIYAGHYPFVISPDRSAITLKLVPTHPKQRLYAGMLIAASRHYLPVEWQDVVTHDFAQICYLLFSNLMPVGTEIKRLPASTQQFPPHEQIQYMARMARGRVLCQSQDFDSEELPQPFIENQPSLTAGIVDMLAWHPMGDERDGIPVAIARCDCEGAQFLSSQQTLLNLETQFYTRHPWASYHFSPVDLYTAQKDWAIKHQLGRAIVLDRYRILNLAESYFIYNDVPDMDHIDLLHKATPVPDLAT